MRIWREWMSVFRPQLSARGHPRVSTRISSMRDARVEMQSANLSYHVLDSPAAAQIGSSAARTFGVVLFWLCVSERVLMCLTALWLCLGKRGELHISLSSRALNLGFAQLECRVRYCIPASLCQDSTACRLSSFLGLLGCCKLWSKLDQNAAELPQCQHRHPSALNSEASSIRIDSDFKLLRCDREPLVCLCA